MTDDVDVAQARQETLNRTALEHHRNRSEEHPVLVDGFSCCRDCGNPIPAERLQRVTTSRCIFCQEDHEHRMGIRR